MSGEQPGSDIPRPRRQGRWQYVIEVAQPQAADARHEWRVIRFPAPGTLALELGVPVAQGTASSRAEAIQQAVENRRTTMLEYRDIDEG